MSDASSRDEPLFFESLPLQEMERGFREAGNSPYVATVLTLLATSFEPRDRSEALDEMADGTWRARSTVLTEAGRATVEADGVAGLRPLASASRIHAARLERLAR